MPKVIDFQTAKENLGQPWTAPDPLGAVAKTPTPARWPTICPEIEDEIAARLELQELAMTMPLERVKAHLLLERVLGRRSSG